MEIPFKYIVLYIIKTLNDRKMSLIIKKQDLTKYLAEFVKKSPFTIEEKKEMTDDFDLDFEWNDIINTYYQYFDMDSDVLKFDIDYIDELDNLISEEQNSYDQVFVHDTNFTLNTNTTFLSIIGVEINKNLYNFLLDIEKQIENCYNVMAELEIYDHKKRVSNIEIIDSIKKLKILKTVMLLNTKNLLPEIKQKELILYSYDMADITEELDKINLLTEDEDFYESDITEDTFLRSIFIDSDSSKFNLRDSLILNSGEVAEYRKYSKINFYLTFLNLLEEEIKKANDLLNVELIKIKYKIMNTLDSTYNMSTILGNKTINDTEFKEDYYFAYNQANYFINELLNYDDEKYRNKNFDTDNIMIYLNNIMKKLLIETYYILTKDKEIIRKIKENKLYGINNISSSFLKEIVEKPKIKIK